jgi:3-hydroxyacyl-CoA dehydrogenase/enoyl-CoA hydratase/3-hydroxybutyryl-CoA epimerase
MTTSLSFTLDKNGIANLIFDLPNEKVNKLSAPVLAELETALNVIDGNKGIRVLLITSAKKDIFIAGADINEIKDLRDVDDARKKVSRGQEILSKIAALKIPTIAVINGACLGGGLELALACKYRVAVINKKTALGLPEVNLGIIPGFGGTQRLPRLVGLQESLKMILSGKAVDAKKAFKIGLVDELAREEFLSEKLTEVVVEILKPEEQNRYLQSRKAACSKRYIFESLLLGKFFIFHLAAKDLFEKTKGHYPAPFAALEVIKKTYTCKLKPRHLKIELDYFCKLCTGDISKNLIEIFFTSEALKKDVGIENVGQTKEIKAAALIGAGVMGGGIAWLFANNEINIRIKDITQNAIALGFNQVSKIFNQLKKIRKVTPYEVDMKMANISAGLDFSGFDKADIVIEAVVEKMAVKKNILTQVENEVAKDALIVSNTSSLSISEMAQALQNPERFAGMHFFNPVNRMPLVEVIRGEKTSDETVAAVVKLSKKLGKTPIVVKDVSGFLVNRILLPCLNEASYLLQDGADIKNVDAVMEDFGMPMGPFVLCDVVGIDVAGKVAHCLFESYGERMRVADIFEEIYKNRPDLLGKKVGKGFYIHEEKMTLNLEVEAIVNRLRDERNIRELNVFESDVIDRCILTMVNEAAKCLEEGVVKNARYLDMAMIMGAGFPAFRGGLLRYADSRGIDDVVNRLQELEKDLGKRFEVSPLLLKMAKSGEKFYS